MTSKQLGEFLECESDATILQCQYCIISSRIRLRSRDMENVASFSNVLFPDSQVLISDGEEEFEARYYKQIDNHKSLLADIVLISEKKGYHVIFLQTHTERKLGYMSILRAYIHATFKCPVYDYEYFTLCNDDELEKYDHKKVIKKCEKIVEKNKSKIYKKEIQSEQGRERIIKEIEGLSKKNLIKRCKKEGLYRDGMSKDDMILALTSFI